MLKHIKGRGLAYPGEGAVGDFIITQGMHYEVVAVECFLDGFDDVVQDHLILKWVDKLDDFKMRCIRCDKHLEESMCEGYFIPSDGVDCQVYGNFGSRVYDPANHLSLRLFLCDDCLLEKQPYILECTKQLRPDTTYKLWN